MSPAVTMNCLLALAEQGYGEDLGLATILNAAAPIDNVHIVSMFTIFLSVLFDNGTVQSFYVYINNYSTVQSFRCKKHTMDVPPPAWITRSDSWFPSRYCYGILYRIFPS